MMRLKKTVLDIVTGDSNDGGVLFEAPPQGNPRISYIHAEQLAELCNHIRARTPSVLTITCLLHRLRYRSLADGCVDPSLTITCKL